MAHLQNHKAHAKRQEGYDNELVRQITPPILTSSTAHRNFQTILLLVLFMIGRSKDIFPTYIILFLFFTDRDFSFVVSFGQISVSIDEAHSKEKDRLPYYCCVAR